MALYRPDSRIDQHVQEVDDEVHDDEAAADEIVIVVDATDEVEPAAEVESDADAARWAEPAAEPVRRPRRSRRATSATIAQAGSSDEKSE